jgi:hypothetical protein
MLVYPDNKHIKTKDKQASNAVLRVIALIILFISVFGFFFKILFF